MSRTHKDKPTWVRLKSDKYAHTVHRHENGICEEEEPTSFPARTSWVVRRAVVFCDHTTPAWLDYQKQVAAWREDMPWFEEGADARRAWRRAEPPIPPGYMSSCVMDHAHDDYHVRVLMDWEAPGCRRSPNIRHSPCPGCVYCEPPQDKVERKKVRVRARQATVLLNTDPDADTPLD